ncbi:2380_t:CDS:1 [Dentiscutata erythropus]|uniref:2380_t:CDS:1 n=1 Tax=Dentiscutata erythropus TaxID=1348616 RepID=A0A9N9JTD5_9GLOM|nr:2380_t:CDS:1 [Dentiscutata erythropus]
MTSLEKESMNDLSISSNNISASSLTHSNKRQRTCSPSFDEIWSFLIKGSSRDNGHYRANCYYCTTGWERGKPQVMKAHLVNHCEHCPENTSNYWHQKLIEEANTIHGRTVNLQDANCILLE